MHKTKCKSLLYSVCICMLSVTSAADKNLPVKPFAAFDPADRRTYDHSGQRHDCIVVGKSATSVSLIKLDYDADTADSQIYHFVTELKSDKLNDSFDDSEAYAFEDIKIGDHLRIVSSLYNDESYIIKFSILRRPGSLIPPSRNLPWDRAPYFERKNILNSYYIDGVKVREYDLRRHGNLIESIRVYGKRPGDDKKLAELKISTEEELKAAIDIVDKKIVFNLKQEEKRMRQQQKFNK